MDGFFLTQPPPERRRAPNTAARAPVTLLTGLR